MQTRIYFQWSQHIYNIRLPSTLVQNIVVWKDITENNPQTPRILPRPFVLKFVDPPLPDTDIKFYNKGPVNLIIFDKCLVKKQSLSDIHV